MHPSFGGHFGVLKGASYLQVKTVFFVSAQCGVSIGCVMFSVKSMHHLP